MPFDVNGCTALVTGANRGIGESILDTLIAKGAEKVYAAVRNIESALPLVERHGEKVVTVAVDLEKPESIEAAAMMAVDVSLVVNNAGVLKTSAATDENAVDNLQFEIDVNVHGLLNMARAFAPVLKANGGGAFVQLNSVASLIAFPPFATYSASKAAAYSLTQALRATLGEQGTQVLSVHPGPIETSMAADAGLEDTDPPSVVADGIVSALAAGEFHLFPDKFAKQVWEGYQSFAKNVVEKGVSE